MANNSPVADWPKLPNALYVQAHAKARQLGVSFNEYLASVVRREMTDHFLQPNPVRNDRAK